MGTTGWAVAAVAAPVALVVLPLLLGLARAAGGRVARSTARLRAPLARLLRARSLAAGLGLGASAAASVAAPAPATALAAPAPVRPTDHGARPVAAQPDGVHVVRPGESLWSIASQHLGPSATSADVAAAWPRWYRANRAAIGPDPSLIRVGLRLRAPAPATVDRARPPGTTTSPTSTTRRRTGTSASPRSADPTPARTAARPTVRADSLDPDRR